MDEREKFWNSEEKKEKDRISDEKVRKKSEIKQLDLERRSREERESELREAAIKVFIEYFFFTLIVTKVVMDNKEPSQKPRWTSLCKLCS